jgi:hypothetical protein
VGADSAGAIDFGLKTGLYRGRLAWLSMVLGGSWGRLCWQGAVTRLTTGGGCDSDEVRFILCVGFCWRKQITQARLNYYDCSHQLARSGRCHLSKECPGCESELNSTQCGHPCPQVAKEWPQNAFGIRTLTQDRLCSSKTHWRIPAYVSIISFLSIIKPDD